MALLRAGPVLSARAHMGGTAKSTMRARVPAGFRQISSPSRSHRVHPRLFEATYRRQRDGSHERSLTATRAVATRPLGNRIPTGVLGPRNSKHLRRGRRAKLKPTRSLHHEPTSSRDLPSDDDARLGHRAPNPPPRGQVLPASTDLQRDDNDEVIASWETSSTTSWKSGTPGSGSGTASRSVPRQYEPRQDSDEWVMGVWRSSCDSDLDRARRHIHAHPGIARLRAHPIFSISKTRRASWR